MDTTTTVTNAKAPPQLTRRWPATVIGFLVIAMLVGVRAASEYSMMKAHGTDPQMPIWIMFFVVKLAMWFFDGLVAVGLLTALWNKRWGALAGTALLVVWVAMISWASWSYYAAGRALADATDPTTPVVRLQELVHFDGIQAGYELANRLAENPSTPPASLRELYDQSEMGTRMVLAMNPNTPIDILEELVDDSELWVQKCLAQNPKLPPSVRQKLTEHSDIEVRKHVPDFGE